MKRETCMFKPYAGMLDEFTRAIRAKAEVIEAKCERLKARNASAWTVAGFVYFYAEFDDDNKAGLKELLATWRGELAEMGVILALPAEMRLMYHDIGVVREDKHLIRRRVFATHLKPGCADEYQARHQKLIGARGDRVSDGPETNFTIHCALDEYIFGYCELVKSYDHEMTEEEKTSTIAWETKQLEIMDWYTDDVDWITGQKHEKMQNLFLQKGYEA